MADQSEVDRILSQYGQGYTSPALNSGDGEIASTPDILAQYGANERMASGLPGFLRRIGAGLRGLAPSQVTTPVNTLTGREPPLQARENHANPLMLMGGEGADTMASWVDMHPGVDRGQSRPQDLLAPLGLSAMAPLTAVNNAAGIFGGRLARTADREALSRAEEMAGRGMPRNEIWDQTGWFQGRDGQWRFEIDDTGSQFRREPITPHERNVVGDIRFGDHFDHPELFAAYPGLERAPFSVEPHGGIGSYDPVTGTVAVGRHPPRDIQGGRRGAALHEGQHAVQAYENFARGAALEVYAPEARALQEQMRESQAVIRMRELVAAGTETPQSAAEWVGRGESIAPDRLLYLDREFPGSAMADRVQYSREQWQRANPLMKYLRTAGEVESRNVQERANLTGEERRSRPPWETQDVPDADQILRQYSSGPQASTKGPSYGLTENMRADTPGEFGYGIVRDGRPIGTAVGHIVMEDGQPIARVNWLGADGLENGLGVEGLRQVREAFRRDFPDVTRFEGIRISGARQSAARQDPFREVSPYQSVTLKGGDAPERPIGPTADDVLRQYSQGPQMSAPDTKGPRRPQPSEVTEWPVSAAIKVGDNVYGGTTHFDAIRNSVPNAVERDLFGDDLSGAFRSHHGTQWEELPFLDGFVTNTGRYVSRDEAAQLASAKLGRNIGTTIGLDAVAWERALARQEGRRPHADVVPAFPSWLTDWWYRDRRP